MSDHSPPDPRPSRALLNAVATRLQDVAREAEALGAQICDDAAVVERHGPSLQGIDRISQTLTQIADVLAAEDPAATVASLSLGDLRNGLLAAA